MGIASTEFRTLLAMNLTRSPHPLRAPRLLGRVLATLALAGLAHSASAHPAGRRSAPPAARDVPTMPSVQRLIDAKRWSKAAAALEQITAAEPNNGEAWFYLAFSHHNDGQLRSAIRCGQRAAAFPSFRGTALYNIACAYSLLGELDPASESLQLAQAAGFLDFDGIATDDELANLRAAGRITLPPASTYVDLRGRNGVVIPYRVLLPADFDPAREYSVAVAFAQDSGGKRCTDWTLAKLWSAHAAQPGWILVCAVAPERGWLNHPAHHALEDLFKQLRKEYNVTDDRFHLMGFGAGARVAATYARMSAPYTASLTALSATCFDSWDASDFRSVRRLSIHQVVGSEDPELLRSARAAEASFQEHGVGSRLTVFEGDGVTLESAHGGDLFARVLAAATAE